MSRSFSLSTQLREFRSQPANSLAIPYIGPMWPKYRNNQKI